MPNGAITLTPAQLQQLVTDLTNLGTLTATVSSTQSDVTTKTTAFTAAQTDLSNSQAAAATAISNLQAGVTQFETDYAAMGLVPPLVAANVLAAAKKIGSPKK